ncbi:MAG TPA: beta-ketoacyl-ACP synthase II [Candidatus Limnocylindria bacterium]|nr:beta-ketoacyl-ACP synthase II [Candidatus Limnocylindria bacterium]
MADWTPPPPRSSAERGERRVVVTGMGAVTPIGNDVAGFWESLMAGRSGIGAVESFDASRIASRVAGEIRDFDAERFMPKKEVRRNDRYVHYAWAATTQALADAGLPNPIVDDTLAERTGVIIGSGIGGINTMIRDVIEAHDLGIERIGPFLVTALIPDMGAGYVAIYANARGPNYATISACSSSNHAIGDALNIIRRGDADVMIAGGAEAGIGEIPMAAFSAMRALSTKRNHDPERASRPFDADRDGFVIADGAGIVVLEALDFARARGARVHAELVGYAASDDASHITLPAPGGRGAVASMRLALADAGLTSDDVDYINAHGTSTPPNDRAETAAIKQVFGERAYAVPVSSTKSMTGHLMGAGGGVEAIASVLAIQNGCLPPTINYENPDPECDLDYVPNRPRQADVRTAMSNSFGFGGHNATVVFRRWEEPEA